MSDWIRWSCRKPCMASVLTPCFLVAAYLGWRAQLARGVTEREALMNSIAHLGGRFSLDTDFPDEPDYGPPQWLKSLIGESYFSNIVSVNLGMTPFNDATLERLTRQKHLQSLGIWQTKLNDESLSSLSQLPELETLDISQTEVTDDGLKQLGQMKSMRVLVVGGDRITDAGLEPLKQMSQLTLLCVVGNQFSLPARQALEKALPEATVVFVPLPQVAGEARRPPVVTPAKPPSQPVPSEAPAAPKAPSPNQFI
ncbi:MAG TPA: hypothetical protein VFI31_23970 [Pirellulales bacterium]|nr:hypothetical protein [Pirellulales bacterium]